jgi:hypothetical protein
LTIICGGSGGGQKAETSASPIERVSQWADPVMCGVTNRTLGLLGKLGIIIGVE